MEHKVIHDELAASREQVGERLASVWAIEDVLLRDALPGQATLQMAHFVALASKRFLLFQKDSPSGEPFLSGHNRMICDQIVVDHGRALPAVRCEADVDNVRD